MSEQPCEHLKQPTWPYDPVKPVACTHTNALLTPTEQLREWAELRMEQRRLVIGAA